MKMKKILIINLITLLFFASSVFAQSATVAVNTSTLKNADSTYKLKINNEMVSTDTPPVLIDGISYIPVRASFEKMGATVKWDSATQKMTIQQGTMNVELKANSTDAKINGQAIVLGAATKMINERLMVHLAFYKYNLNMNIGSFPEEHLITIDSIVQPKESVVVLPAGEYKLQINNEAVSTDSPPVVEGGIAYVPVRATFEKLGALVKWDVAAQKMSISLEGTSLELVANSKNANKDGKTIVLDQAAKLIKERLMVPLDFFKDNLNMKIEVSAKEKNMTIDSNSSTNTKVETLDISIGTETKPVVMDGVYKLMIDETSINTDSPPVIENGISYVPARAAFEKLGATVIWDAALQKMSVTLDGMNIELLLNNNNAKINGNTVVLSSAAKMIKSRLMVPLNFFKEALNMGIRINAEEKWMSIDAYYKLKINDEIVKSAVAPVLLDGSSYVPVRTTFEKLGATVTWDNTTKKTTILYGDIKIELVSNNVILINSSATNFDLPLKNIKGSLMIPLRFFESQLDMTVGFLPEERVMLLEKYRVLQNVQVLPQNSQDQVILSLDQLKQYRMYRLTDSDRIVIDFTQMIVPEEIKKTDFISKQISAVRAYQFDKGTGRVVIDLKNQAQYVVEETKTQLKVNIYTPTYKNITYSNMGDRASVLLNSVDLTKDAETIEKQYTEKIDPISGKYTMTFPSSLANLGSGVMIINDDILSSIEIINNTSNNTTSLVFNAKGNYTYETVTRSEVNDTAITILKPILKTDKLVVIDAGHGGKEPGAVSNGIYEKDLNLDIAKRLNKLLEEKNIKTYMIRNDDRFINLYERAYIANGLNASLFVSIHNNALDNPDYDGTMTLYTPNTPQGADMTGKRFAQIIQDSLISKLKTTDRKIIERPYLVVLKATKMPSVLTEIGFMTNKKNRESLETEEFRQKAAEALCEGIIKSLTELK